MQEEQITQQLLSLAKSMTHLQSGLRAIRHSIVNAQAIQNATPSWSLEKILYLRIVRNPVAGEYPYMYDTTYSGYYELTGGLDNFLVDLPSAPPDPATRTFPLKDANALDFTLEYSSYVVAQFDPNGKIRFMNNQDAVATDEPVAYGDYINLSERLDDMTYVGNMGIVPNGNIPPPQSPGKQCHIAVFSAKSPSHRGSQAQPIVDCWNFYIESKKPQGGWSPDVLDPEIKNTGHTG